MDKTRLILKSLILKIMVYLDCSTRLKKRGGIDLVIEKDCEGGGLSDHTQLILRKFSLQAFKYCFCWWWWRRVTKSMLQQTNAQIRHRAHTSKRELHTEREIAQIQVWNKWWHTTLKMGNFIGQTIPYKKRDRSRKNFKTAFHKRKSKSIFHTDLQMLKYQLN